MRALGLLECFSSEFPEWTLTDLSNETGLTVSTTHRLLRTLIGQGFLVFDDGTKRYSLGPAVMQLAGAIIHRNDLHHVVMPFLETLRRESGETVGLHLVVDHQRVCIIELESNQRIRMSSGVGRRYPLHRGAAGKGILAQHSPAEYVKYLEWIEQTGAAGELPPDLDTELENIRESGYATSHSEVVDGASALAAAIVDSSSFPIGSLNITGPATRWTDDRMEGLVQTLLSAVTEIESQLGYVRRKSV